MAVIVFCKKTDLFLGAGADCRPDICQCDAKGLCGMSKMQEAARLLMSGQIEDSLTICNEIVADSSKEEGAAGVYYLLALIHNIKKEFKEAVKACDKAIELGAGVAEIYVEKARALQELGDIEGATAAATKAVELAPPEAQ